jgi:hypothetical protein
MTRRQGVDIAHPARKAIESVQLDAFWVRGPISARTSDKPEAKHSAKYSGEGPYYGGGGFLRVLCCAVLCTFCCGEAFG